MLPITMKRPFKGKKMFPRDIQGNVLSLIANKANNGQPYASGVANPKWYDLSKYKNDCQLVNQAGTGVSGFNSEVINGKTVYFNKLDAVDDYGSFANTPSLDITTGEFVLACTFRIATGFGASAGFLICKNLDASATTQYGIVFSVGRVYLHINGAARGAGEVVSENTWYHIIFYRNSVGVITSYLSKILGTPATYANVIVSQPHMRMGARSANAVGTTTGGLFKGDIATQSIYQYPTLNINQIIKSEMEISYPYTNKK